VADRIDYQNNSPDLWLCDVTGGNDVRFTFVPAVDQCPVWSPDGGRIVWSSNREGVANLYQKAASGAGQDLLLLRSEYTKFPTDWSRDGRFIIYFEVNPKTKNDVWVLPVAGNDDLTGGEPKPLLQTEANESGRHCHLTGNGWLMRQMNQADMKFTCRASPWLAANDRSQLAAATTLVGGTMERSCSITLRTAN
jgi:dipeptidyl aminopeptidase/acylaminoacyl peptidase